MRNRIIALKYLYREYNAFNLPFTFVAAFTMFILGGGIMHVFWIKVIGYGGTTGFYLYTRRKHLYFFYNLNQNIRDLFVLAYIIDALITVLFLLTISPIFR